MGENHVQILKNLGRVFCPKSPFRNSPRLTAPGAFFMRKAMPETRNPEVLWGAEQIGDFINKSKRATFHLLETGKIPARKIGHQWTATRKELAAIFGGDHTGSK
jgi:hypothetical protein